MQTSQSSYEPYLSFYGHNKISPVRQDISDIQKHFQRREYLYRYLGLPPFSLAEKTVVEFGPGSGYNALYTTLLNPRRYLLVDGNPTGLQQSEKLLREHFPVFDGHEFVLSRIQDYLSDERFDLVICEGVIPHQKDPVAFVRHVASFVRPGGVLSATSADYVSVFAEVLRRVICDTIVRNDEPLADKVAKLVPIFRSHYATIPGASRPVEDWLIDSLLDTWGNALFSFEDVVKALDPSFEIYGSSPKFIADWRWYKDLNSKTAAINKTAIEQFRAMSLSLIDCRFVTPPLSSDLTSKMAKSCEKAYWAMIKLRNSVEKDFSEVIAICDDVVRAAGSTLPTIAKPVSEVSAYLRNHGAMDPKTCFDTFKAFYGRGQQYLSFVKLPAHGEIRS